MSRSPVGEAFKRYFKSTTLHGFKYLCAVHTCDRVAWLLCCCASTCCAGILCAVVWARFLEVPAILTLCDDVRSATFREDRLPTVAVCPPTRSVAENFLKRLSLNETETKRIPQALARLFVGKPAEIDQLMLLDKVLHESNVTLSQAMIEYTPECTYHAQKCRYQTIMVPCEQLFEKKLMSWGLCCVMHPKKLQNVSLGAVASLYTTQMLDLVLECSEGKTINYRCQFITKYADEVHVQLSPLHPGYFYLAHLQFVDVPESTYTENLVEKTCVRDKSYSKTRCMLRCAELACGCSDPLQYMYDDVKSDLPICPVARISCLRSKEYSNTEDNRCHCLPSCREIIADLVLESHPMNDVQNAIDPLYADVNTTLSIVVNLRVNLDHSRVLVLNPTETWLTLLSSLGGVFNMFMGVGLFSALEFLYLLLVKLPIAIRKSSEMEPVRTPAMTPYTIPVTTR